MYEMKQLNRNTERRTEKREFEQMREAAPVVNRQNQGYSVNPALIGPTIHIKGDLLGEEDLIIQGHVEGTINLKQNTLTIGQLGMVIANIHAKTVIIEGTLKGDVLGEGRVIVRKTSNVHGNITAPHVSLEEGAKFKGCIDMDYKCTASSASSNNAESVSVVRFDSLAGNDKA
jgi:cytoskeletal protein CcmA (bactofilin family)